MGIALKEKSVGWATVREGSGAESLLLRPVPPDGIMPAVEDLGEGAPATPPMASSFSGPTFGAKGQKRPIHVKQETHEDQSWNRGMKGGYGGPQMKRYKGGKGKW